MHALPDWILVRPQTSRRALAHDGDGGRVVAIGVGEAAAAQEANAHDAEVVRAARLDGHLRRGYVLLARIPFLERRPNENAGAEKWRDQRRRHTGDAGNRAP